jgi:hypothetical protein
MSHRNLDQKGEQSEEVEHLEAVIWCTLSGSKLKVEWSEQRGGGSQYRNRRVE